MEETEDTAVQCNLQHELRKKSIIVQRLYNIIQQLPLNDESNQYLRSCVTHGEIELNPQRPQWNNYTVCFLINAFIAKLQADAKKHAELKGNLDVPRVNLLEDERNSHAFSDAFLNL